MVEYFVSMAQVGPTGREARSHDRNRETQESLRLVKRHRAFLLTKVRFEIAKSFVANEGEIQLATDSVVKRAKLADGCRHCHRFVSSRFGGNA